MTSMVAFPIVDSSSSITQRLMCRMSLFLDIFDALLSLTKKPFTSCTTDLTLYSREVSFHSDTIYLNQNHLPGSNLVVQHPCPYVVCIFSLTLTAGT